MDLPPGQYDLPILQSLQDILTVMIDIRDRLPAPELLDAACKSARAAGYAQGRADALSQGGGCYMTRPRPNTGPG